MTRINSAIPVQCLTDEHLMAEYREIKRLPDCWKKSVKSGSINKIPAKFTLGKGHVLFFLNKHKFAFIRCKQLLNECIKRGFSVQDYLANWYHVQDPHHWLNHDPTSEERDLLIEIISSRISESKKQHFHFYGDKITKEEAILLLKSFTI